MRQFKTRGDRSDARRQRMIKAFVAIFMVGIMVLSTLAFFFSPDPTKTRYNGYNLKATVDSFGFVQYYTTKVDGTPRQFYAAPDMSLGYNMPPGFVESLQDAVMVMVLFDPKDNLTPVYDQIRYDFEENMRAPIVAGVTQYDDVYASLPVLSCSDATGEIPFILFREGNASITFEEGCYVIEGSQFDFALLRDRVLYRYHGITTT